MKKNIRRITFRILAAVVGAIAFIALILIVEAIFGSKRNCLPGEAWLLCHLRESVLLGIIESFSIFVAVVLFFLEAPERDKQAHYEAWKVIDAAYGIKNSYARFQALQDLNEDGVSLRRLNAPEADLRGINLEAADLCYAYLSGSNLSYAKLNRANLSHTDLIEADLNNTDLTSAKLIGSNLAYVELIDAEIANADLVGANLTGANLVGANLSHAYLGDVDLCEAKLDNANLKKTKLFGVKNLTPTQVKAAANWQEALFDANLRQKLGL